MRPSRDQWRDLANAFVSILGGYLLDKRSDCHFVKSDFVQLLRYVVNYSVII